MEYNLERFYEAQEGLYQRGTYNDALSEIKDGCKYGHWIWYIFPQIDGLGFSPIAKYYAIESIEEARAYIEDPVLRKRLIEISEALLEIESNDAEAIMGWPDNLKLRSSMTLFREASPEIDVFQKVLDKYYEGIPDSKTLKILKEKEAAEK